MHNQFHQLATFQIIASYVLRQDISEDIMSKQRTLLVRTMTFSELSALSQANLYTHVTLYDLLNNAIERLPPSSATI